MRWLLASALALAAVIYSLDRGMIVWAETTPDGSKRCYYLFASGVAVDNGMFVTNHCRVFRHSSFRSQA